MKKIREWLAEYQEHLGYIAISIIFLIVTGVYAYIRSDFMSLIIFLYFVGDAIYRVSSYFHYKEAMLKRVESITYRVKHAGETAFNQLPLGILLYDEDYEVVWFNKYLKRIFNQELHEQTLKELNEQLYHRSLNDEEFELTINHKTYVVQHMKNERLMYFSDNTEFKELSKKHLNEQPVVGVLVMDNYDEVIHNLNEQEKSEFYGKIVSIIMQWADTA